MKRTTTQTTLSPERTPSDNLCKRLAEEHPAQFAEWLFGVRQVKVVKTELSREPIRGDSVVMSSADELFHTEFQTTAQSRVPMPLRMLDYKVGFQRQNPKRRVRQALVVLKDTGATIPDHYADEYTTHHYPVIKMWEVDPRTLLKYEGLIPLATLCRAEEGEEQLLAQVAARIQRIKSPERRRDIVNASRVLAGLRYDLDPINRWLKESSMLEESVVYQDILQKGEVRGERKLALRQLERRFGKLSLKMQRQIERLPGEMIERLGDDLLDFTTKADLTVWLQQHAVAH